MNIRLVVEHSRLAREILPEAKKNVEQQLPDVVPVSIPDWAYREIILTTLRRIARNEK